MGHGGKLMKPVEIWEGHVKRIMENKKMSFEEVGDWAYKCILCTSCQGWYREHPPAENWQEKQTYYRTCPMMDGKEFEISTPGGLMWVIKGYLDGIVPLEGRALEQVFMCTVCKACEYECYGDHGEKITNIVRAVREKLVEDGNVPPLVRKFLENVSSQGNPWGEAKAKRNDWKKGVEGLRNYAPNDGYLLYVGCVGSYDDACQVMPRSLSNLLVKANVSFGVLSDEECDGNEINLLGETYLFEEFRDRNIQQMNKLGVKKIVVLSPHSYNVFKKEYEGFPEVIHYTQLVWDLIQNGKIKPLKFEKKVTYHDPCLLGRANNIYDEPRKILSSIPGLDLVEMKRNKVQSFCCGGGSGNFYTDITGSRIDSPSRARVREAYETGAEVLAISCPICMLMFKDALKAEGLEEKISLMDISEIVRASL
jgi:Fe-S oxidoreductase